MTDTDLRLIEDAIPLDVIGEACGDEKTGGRKGHPATLHLWWARRPLAASRAVVYAALVPARKGGKRKREQDREFFASLCQWDTDERHIAKARSEIRKANGGKAPKVVDLFAGGGAIPLEAARLGCEVTANELNPVAHLIERMMLEYPQKYPGLADDVRKWGKIWIDRAWEKLKDLYPPIPEDTGPPQLPGMESSSERRPLAYLWTRTVRCSNPAMPAHDVHLVRQTWLGQKPGKLVALRPEVDHDSLTITYRVVTATTAAGLGFNPAEGSRHGQVACRICGAVVTSQYIKAEGQAGRMGLAPLAAVVLKRPKPGKKRGIGREYLPVGSYPLPDEAECRRRLAELAVAPPNDPIVTGYSQAINVPLYGLTTFSDLFTPRQLLTLCILADGVRDIYDDAIANGMASDRAGAVATALAMVVDKIADHSSTLVPWISAASAEKCGHTFPRQALSMTWDFAEASPFGGSSGDVRKYLSEIAAVIDSLAQLPSASYAVRGSATDLPIADESVDAVITDPPYYDNISYADVSDFFYVWLRRAVGFLYPDDLGGRLTPKKNEAVVAHHRHERSTDPNAAVKHYESLIGRALREAHRILKPNAPLVCVYAHKTTQGWASLVDVLRRSGFVIMEAWPLNTEMATRSRGQDSAALATSIFLVARKRPADAGIGSEAEVLAHLDKIIAERLIRLEEAGVAGADLVISTVGAGLRALTAYERVEQDNGAELRPEKFLELVQGKVIDAIFGSVAGVDSATLFYLAAQMSYGYSAVAFDEANNLARMCGANLDGLGGLTSGANPLVKKAKGKISLRDFEDRGHDGRLGLPDDETDAPASLIDIAQALLWRAENAPRTAKEFVLKSRANPDQLRQVVQALAGKALRSSSGPAKGRESQAAETLLVSWRTFV